MSNQVMQLTDQQDYVCTSRSDLRALFGDMPAYIALRHPVPRPRIPEFEADLEGTAPEALYQQRL